MFPLVPTVPAVRVTLPGMRPVLLVLLALMVVPSVASAHHAERSWTAEEVVARSHEIAVAAWPGSPCSGRERIAMSDNDADREGHRAVAWVESCTAGMYADAMTDPIAWCSVLVHEYGHLAGHGHSPDPESIMYGQMRGRDLRWPECATEFRPVSEATYHPLAFAREEVARRKSHRWSCRRSTRHVVRCDGKPRAGVRTRGVARFSRQGRVWDGTVRYVR